MGIISESIVYGYIEERGRHGFGLSLDGTAYFRIVIVISIYSGLNLNQDKATKPQTVQIVRQGEATPY